MPKYCLVVLRWYLERRTSFHFFLYPSYLSY